MLIEEYTIEDTIVQNTFYSFVPVKGPRPHVTYLTRNRLKLIDNSNLCVFM
jgi:hypothetical protein